MIRLSLTIEDDCLPHAMEKLYDAVAGMTSHLDAGKPFHPGTYTMKSAGTKLVVEQFNPDRDFLAACGISPEVSRG